MWFGGLAMLDHRAPAPFNSNMAKRLEPIVKATFDMKH